MTPGRQARSAYHEELPLAETGEFTAECALTDLGVDPELCAALTQEGPLCFLDFEATGLSTDSDALIEVGAITVRPGSDQAEIFRSYIHTELILSPFIQRLTGISQADLEGAPSPAVVMPALDKFIDDVTVVAHNIDFERAWLSTAASTRFGAHPFLDTIELLALVYPDSRNMKLDTFCREKLDRRERHRALDDALDTLRIVVRIWEESRDGLPHGLNARDAMRAHAPSASWLARLESLPESDKLRVAPRAQPDEDALLSPIPLQYDAIISRLQEEDDARRVLPDYSTRLPQLDLVANVFDCFAGKGGRTVHICEAGTGIGKTLAYLSVAIPFVRQSGEQIVISTSTKLLQSQLIGKDIPAVARLMGYPDLRFTAIKGRANYLCRSRLDRFLDAPPELPLGGESLTTALLAAFSNSTGHGEVDRLPGVLYQMHPELERYKREVTSAEASECSRQTCETTRGDCVFRAARARLDGAEIIVVNHDLLLRWPPDYPPLTHLIIDEVHELAERADGAYARSAEAVEIIHRIETVLGRRGDTDIRPDGDLIEQGERSLRLVTAIGNESWDLVSAGRSNQGYRDELAIPLDGPGPTWGTLVDACSELAGLLNSMARRLSILADDDESTAAGAAESLVDAATVLRESFPLAPDDLVVRFRGLSRHRGQSWRLVATPVSPAADFQFEILDRAATLFGTSATVMVGDDTRGALGNLELAERAGSRFTLDEPIESTFDYANNLEVLFIDEKTDPSRLVDKTVDVLATVSRKLGGRTMGLFTSRERLSTVSDMLYTALSSEGISIIAPSAGNADPHDLVRTFTETDHAVLLGARAFWQGVDVAGDACQAVVIEKLPFDVPGDPLIQRRGALVEREGGNSFMDYMLPRMLLRLKQMMGRLIRTPNDRGVVIVVEPRCDRRYFERLRDAVPPHAIQKRIKLTDLELTLDEFFDQ
jgi:Rad3-related DNA helicase/DNA polymerase III epsilon subunit-like protein